MIRAGYLIDNQGYQSGTPDTYMSGWGYEYLQDISYHTEGWKYEYVLGTFSELIAKHEAGEIDVALPFAKDYWIAEQEGYAQSDSLASSSLVALYKGDDLGSALSSILVQPNSIVSESF